VEGIAYLRDNLRPGDQFVDIGAWIGPYTLLASRLVESAGAIYSFEPDPVARAALDRNIAQNSAHNIKVLPWAVTEQRGRTNLISPALGDSKSQTRLGGNGPDVESISLDEFCQTGGFIPSVIKIDVEGGETGVFAGGRSSLRQARAILLEFHELEIRESGADPKFLWSQLFELGKKVSLLTPSHGLPAGTELSPENMLPGNVHVLIH
jgi:FkbM family methyltransferase